MKGVGNREEGKKGGGFHSIPFSPLSHFSPSPSPPLFAPATQTKILHVKQSEIPLTGLGYFWFETTWQGGHVWGQYNIIFFPKNLHENRVKFPEERNAFVLDHQHGRRDVTCKPANPREVFPFLVQLFNDYMACASLLEIRTRRKLGGVKSSRRDRETIDQKLTGGVLLGVRLAKMSRATASCESYTKYYPTGASPVTIPETIAGHISAPVPFSYL